MHAVFTAADINPDVKEAWHAVAGKDVPDTPRPPLAEGEVKFVGDPVALVIAESRYVAEDAVDLVDVDYEPLPAIADFRKASGAAAGVPVVHDAYPDNVAGGMGGAPPDEEMFADARARRSTSTSTNRCTSRCRWRPAAWSSNGRPATEELTVWASTQTPHELRAFAARLLGIPAQGVRVIMRDTGGAFGQKVVPMREDMCILLAARKVPAALKWIEDRRENLMSAGQSRHVDGTVRMAFDDDGKILAADIDFVQDVGVLPDAVPGADHRRHRHVLPRAVPGAEGQLQLQDGVLQHRRAARLPRPVAVRNPHAGNASRHARPARWAWIPSSCGASTSCAATRCRSSTPTACRTTTCAPADTFEQAVKILDHEGFRKEQAEALAQGRYIGLGFSAYIEPTGAATGHLATEGATIRMEPTGKINVYVNGGSCGNSIETTVVQLTADALGANIDDVSTIQGDTAVTPYGAGTQGSRSGPMTAGAVNEAGTILRKQIVAMAAQRLGVEESDIELADSRATRPRRSREERQLRRHRLPLLLRARTAAAAMSPTLEATARFNSQAMIHWANATHACTCEVDVETGHVTLTRYIVSEDVGPMINPNVVEGQVAGGTVQGIGGALLEHLAYDDAGNPVASTFVDYLLPTATEVPAHRVRARRDPRPGRRRLQGRGRGRRHRIAARGHQRHQRRAGTARRDRHPTARQPRHDRRTHRTRRRTPQERTTRPWN